MIKVRAVEKDGMISLLQISGHAGAAEKGKDLVCAAVSGIAFGLLNAADTLIPSAVCRVADNLITIEISHPDSASEPVMRTGLIQLETVRESSQKYIEIQMEV